LGQRFSVSPLSLPKGEWPLSCCPALVDVLEELASVAATAAGVRRWRVEGHPRSVSCVIGGVGQQADDRHAPLGGGSV
jgi:hypothetical protein